jgi:hypothetical protein
VLDSKQRAAAPAHSPSSSWDSGTGGRSRASSAGYSAGYRRDEFWGEGGELSARFASPTTPSNNHHQQQQRYHSSRTPTRSSSSSTTPRRSVQFSRDSSMQPSTTISSSSARWGMAAADIPRIQIRSKSPAEGGARGWGGGGDSRPKSPWGQGGGGTPRASSARTPPPRSYSAHRREGGGNGQYQAQRLAARSPRSSFTQSQQQQRVVPSVVLRCININFTLSANDAKRLTSYSSLDSTHILLHSPRSLDDTDDVMASSYSSARSPSSNHKVARPPSPPAPQPLPNRSPTARFCSPAAFICFRRRCHLRRMRVAALKFGGSASCSAALRSCRCTPPSAGAAATSACPPTLPPCAAAAPFQACVNFVMRCVVRVDLTLFARSDG